MIYTIIEAIEYALEEQGEPQSHYWLSSQMDEAMRCSGQDFGQRICRFGGGSYGDLLEASLKFHDKWGTSSNRCDEPVNCDNGGNQT